MHPIRQDILRRLILNSKLRFSRLKPEDIESNHFIYYLKQLMNEGLVVKEDGLYTLTNEGKHLASIVSLDSLTPRLQPKIMTAPVLYDNGKVLVHRRSCEPYIGSISLVNGKLHYGELVADAAHRELQEKTGLQADLRHAGEVYLSYTEQGESLNHLLSHVFVGESYSGELTSTEHSEPMWMGEDELKNMDYVLPGTVEILDLIRQSQDDFFFAEYVYDAAESLHLPDADSETHSPTPKQQ